MAMLISLVGYLATCCSYGTICLFARANCQDDAVAHAESSPGCRIKELNRQIVNVQRMMTSSSTANLPDGGAKLHSRLADLRKELARCGESGEPLLTAMLTFLMQVASLYMLPLTAQQADAFRSTAKCCAHSVLS